MTDQTQTSRLYLLLPQTFEPAAMAGRLAEVLGAVDVACVRLDLGAAPEEDWIEAANHVIGPCHDADVALVVTDHFRLVDRLGLDGVHLTPAGAKLREVRKALGPDRIIGAYAGTSRHNGLTLAEAGADYVAFGPVSGDGALGSGGTVDPDLFAWWSEMIETPCVAEGGITPEFAKTLRDTADFIVPGADVWSKPDAVASLNAYNTALD